MRRRFINKETNYKPLGIKALEDNTVVEYTIQTAVGKLFIRINKGRWQQANSYDVILINKGEQIEFTGSLKISTATPNGVLTFQIDKNVELIGTPMSILKNEELHSRCFAYMFYRCKITSVPEDFLPSKTVFIDCYNSMFGECTELTKAPALPATTLAAYCYSFLFYGCTKLNYIKMLATDISASRCLNDWVSGVASSGTFVKNPEATWDVVGVNGVPSGWTVKFDGEEDGGLLEFTVDGVVYQFEDGMTWADWCDSSYNTGGFQFYMSDSGYAVYTSDYKKYFLNLLMHTTLVKAGAYETSKVDWPMPKG